ncbi:MAG: hypothetical protein AB1758_05200 [Candidatus Eremiobacterota bacterium]
MILVLGSEHEPMVRWVKRELDRRGARSLLVDNRRIPGDIDFHVELPGPAGGSLRGHLQVEDLRVPLADITAIYNRLGFADYRVEEGCGPEHARFVGSQCNAILHPWLNHHPGLVVNRPVSAGSNGSKPHQIRLISRHFRVPETLVTNDPELAEEFFHLHRGRLIYKSVSYVRSIVTPMTEQDLQRLGTVVNCPVQLQEFVEGYDVRVHVLGDYAVFAHKIEAGGSDYRYDKQATVAAYRLPEPVARRCVEVTRELGLVFSGVDLRCTPEGEYVCFEVNPCPAYAFYECRTEQPVTQALCDLLCTGAGASLPLAS